MDIIQTSSTPHHFNINTKVSQIPLDESNVAIKLHFEIEGNFSDSKNKHIIFALDTSGSMNGSAMNFAKEGLKEMIAYLHERDQKKITLIKYNSTAGYKYLHKLPLAECKFAVDSVVCSGRTNFCAAFDSLKNAIKNDPSREICIIFFTDGQDTCNTPEQVFDSMSRFTQFVRKATEFSETHTIGFTDSHDAVLLSNITTIGKNQGTFQYCKSSKDIPICVESVAGLIAGQTLTAKVKISQSEEPIQLVLEELTADGNLKQYEAMFYIQPEVLKERDFLSLEINIDTQSIKKDINVKDIVNDEEGKVSVWMLKLGQVKSEVNKLIKEAINLKLSAKTDPKEVEGLALRLDKQEKILSGLTNKAGKSLKTSQRKDIGPLIYQIKDLISEFYLSLRGLQKGQINNDVIASLNALAYKDIMKKGLQVKLDKRTQRNVNWTNEMYDKIRNISASMDFPGLKEKYEPLASKLGDCVLSCNSFIDALADEDCLCLTFDIARSEEAIVDPTKVIIKTVFPSYITAGSFLYSAQFTIKNNEKAHGGFEKDASGLIVKGAAQENITGVMPLYICKENWSIAKLLMKPTLGWSTTLDPLGYTAAQVRTIPFLIMAKVVEMAHENPASEFLKFQLQLVKETCMQIIRDRSRDDIEVKFCDEINVYYENYMKSPVARTPGVIPSQSVFLCQLYCSIEAGLIERKSTEDMEEFFKMVMEEELRRTQEKLNTTVGVVENKGWDDDNEMSGAITALLFKLLNIDTKKYIEDPLEEFELKRKEGVSLGLSGYQQKFLQAAAVVKIQNKQNNEVEEKKTSDEKDSNLIQNEEITKFDFSLKKNDGYNNFQHRALKEYQATLKEIMKYLYPLRKLFLPQDIDAGKFKAWGIDNDTKFFCLYIQNKLQGRNSSRKAAISSKIYRDPWRQSEEFLQFWCSKLIKDEKSKRINVFITGVKGQKNSANAQIFLETSNVFEAAGAYMGTTVGYDIIYFYKAFMKQKIPLVREKLEMMITGYYNGVRLYKDKELWRPSRYHANAIWRNNLGVFSGEEWKALAPSVSLRFVKGEATCPPPYERKRGKTKKIVAKKMKK